MSDADRRLMGPSVHGILQRLWNFDRAANGMERLGSAFAFLDPFLLHGIAPLLTKQDREGVRLSFGPHVLCFVGHPAAIKTLAGSEMKGLARTWRQKTVDNWLLDGCWQALGSLFLSHVNWMRLKKIIKDFHLIRI